MTDRSVTDRTITDLRARLAAAERTIGELRGMKKHRLTWRKVQKSGRYRMFGEQYELNCDGVSVGRAADDYPRGYYFYVRDDNLGIAWRNTANDPPYATMDEAKAAAMAYVRECLAGTGESDR